MSVFVVDASVAAKWYLEEEHTEVALVLLTGRDELHVPDFFYLEMDSILCKRLRLREMTPAESELARSALRHLHLNVHPAAELRDAACVIATHTGCSFYDALYVALATRLDAQVVTADARLCRGLATGPLRNNVLWIGDLA